MATNLSNVLDESRTGTGYQYPVPVLPTPLIVICPASIVDQWASTANIHLERDNARARAVAQPHGHHQPRHLNFDELDDIDQYQ